MTTVNNWEERIQKDLDDGKFNQICSNETTFKQYVFPIIQAAEKRGREEGKAEAVKEMYSYFKAIPAYENVGYAPSKFVYKKIEEFAASKGISLTPQELIKRNMAKTTISKPEAVQAFDYYEDRIFYKIIPGFFWTTDRVVRKDRLKDWKQWNIVCEELPDKILVNGKEYVLTPNHHKE